MTAWRPLAERFWEKVDIRGPGECWTWTASRNPDGYGQILVEGRPVNAQRVAFFLTHSRWPTACACHTCDNPPCCNPEHLWDGTPADNSRDKVLKGRTRGAIGEKNHSAKLTWDDVAVIRRLPNASAQTMAYIFGITWTHIYKIKRGDIWKESCRPVL